MSTLKIRVMLVILSAGVLLGSYPRQAKSGGLGWVLLAALQKPLNNLLYPAKDNVYPSLAPTLEFETPDGRPLPAVLNARGLAVIVRKGLIIFAKPGVNGPPICNYRMMIDSDEKNSVMVTSTPWVVEINTGTGTIIWGEGKKAKVSKFDFRIGGAYTLQFYTRTRDSKKPGYGAFQMVVVDDQMYVWAATDPEYRMWLAGGGAGSVPAIPVTTQVSGDGQVSHVLGTSYQPMTNGANGIKATPQTEPLNNNAQPKTDHETSKVWFEIDGKKVDTTKTLIVTDKVRVTVGGSSDVKVAKALISRDGKTIWESQSGLPGTIEIVRAKINRPGLQSGKIRLYARGSDGQNLTDQVELMIEIR